jgi:hypothetical protein
MPVRKKDMVTGAADAVDLEHLRRDLDAAEAERADAVRARHDLEDRRDAVLASEDVSQLEQHEVALAAVERRLAVAEARCTRLAGEIEAAEAETEQAVRRAAYKAAEKGLTEARRIVAEEYPAAARAIVEILKRADALRSAAIKANEALPVDAEPLDLILEPGGFNGFHYRGAKTLTETRTTYVNKATGLPAGPYDCPQLHSESHKWRAVVEEVQRPLPPVPSTPHRSVIDFTNLPGFTDETYIWAAACWGRPRSGEVEEINAQFRRTI